MLRSYNEPTPAKSLRVSRHPLCFDFALTISPKITIISNSAPCGYIICRALVQFYIRVWRSLVSRLVRVQEAVGSNPATRTTPGALKSKDFKAPLLFSAFVFPYCFPFRLSRHRSDVGIHPVCAGLLHLSRHMAIDIQGEGCGVVPQVALYGLDIVPSSQGSHRIAVPLRYN